MARHPVRRRRLSPGPILVISHAGDPHARAVGDALRRRGEPVELLDLSRLPGEATLTVDYADPAAPRVEWGAAAPVMLSEARSVWWRRPQFPELSAITDDDAHRFAANEWQEAINGAWQLLGGRWMNPPERDEVAARKALQLRVAAELGLRVPRTLITSDPVRARSFVDGRPAGGTIFKSLSSTHAVWRETRLVGATERDRLDAVRLSPVVFQEYVAGADIRVTAVAGELFAAAIDARATAYPVDFRMRLDEAVVEATTLPPEVSDALLALTERLGLVYGAIDLRRTDAGEHVFLEINTAGEFLFVESRTGQPITRAVSDWLASPA